MGEVRDLAEMAAETARPIRFSDLGLSQADVAKLVEAYGGAHA